MKCGVRFCGGCNPRFDRGKALREIESDVKGLDFSHAVEGETYDCLLVINGCPAHCASYGHFDVKGRIYMVWDYTQMEVVKKQLMEDSKLEMEDL